MLSKRERQREAKRRWNEKNREYLREVAARYREENRKEISLRVWRSHLKKKYGITEVGYFRLLEEQDGECAICGVHCLDLPERLSVDHDHQTGKVRGLLCRTCNLGLANFNDDPIHLGSAIRYVEARYAHTA